MGIESCQRSPKAVPQRKEGVIMRITEKVKKQLHTALSMDDVLFEQHRRLSADIQRQAEKYIRNRKRLILVMGRRKDGTHMRLEVVHVSVSDDGTSVVVKI